MSLDDIRNIRFAKLQRLTERFGSAYPSEVARTHTTAEVRDTFKALLKKKRLTLTVAGRVRAIRGHGGATFLDIDDGSGKLQIYLKKDDIGDESYGAFIDNIDVGDVVEITGSPFLTKRKEPTVLASNWRPLAKALLPLPDSWAGLQDMEERFRTRALDLLTNEETRARFKARRDIISAMRTFLEHEGFEEVETPILQPLYGGALARPFETFHNALEEKLYLRIAPELYLKRLIVGGMPRVFEIGKNFRNEGIDVSHSPEFTELEGYMAYEDRHSLEMFLERFVLAVVKQSVGKLVLSFDGKEIKIKKPFKRIKFMDAIKEYALLPGVESMSVDDLRSATERLGIQVGRAMTKGKLLDEIFKKSVRKHLVSPTFITHHPLDISPLAKAAPGGQYADRVQLIMGGQEVMNAYAELNDPIEQRKRFESQEDLRASGDMEAVGVDESYLESMEYGMPPTAGFGIGVDRFVQLLTDTHNVREVILFPLLRTKKEGEEAQEK
mgnify:CR=1 FL=1